MKNVTPRPWYSTAFMMMMAVLVFIIWFIGWLMVGYAAIIAGLGALFIRLSNKMRRESEV